MSEAAEEQLGGDQATLGDDGDEINRSKIAGVEYWLVMCVREQCVCGQHWTQSIFGAQTVTELCS